MTTKTTRKPAAAKSTANPVAKRAAKPAAAKSSTKATSARMTDAELTRAIKTAVKTDPSLKGSWTRTLRTLRADGKGSAGHVRFRDLFEAATK